jgi:hypothetical protein
MREVINRYYGTRMKFPNTALAEKFISNCKKDPKDNLPVWKMGKEVAGPKPKKQSKEELLALLAEFEIPEEVEVDSELEQARRAYLLKFGKDAHVNATVKSIQKKLEAPDE